MTAQRYKEKEATPVSPKTRRNALAMLRRAPSVAERRGHLSRNVARMVETPCVPRRSVDALTPARAREILAAVKGGRYVAAYALALCGLRAAEIRYQLMGSGKTG